MPANPDQLAAVLRRVAGGVHILRTHRVKPNGSDEIRYSYEDGVPLPIGCGQAAIIRLIQSKRLIPIKGETLFGDEVGAQRYRARTPQDGK